MRCTFRILIIEDDVNIQTNLKDILERDLHQVLVVASFADSAAIVAANQIDLVITERRLPDGAIEEFLPKLRSNSRIPIFIIVTSFGDMQSAIAALRLGVADYVIKPIIPDDIRATVNRVGRERSLQAALAEKHRFADEVLDTAEAIILVLDLNGDVVHFNRYFQDLTGWSLAELAGKDWFENCIVDDDHARLKDVFVHTANDVHTRGVVNDVRGKNGHTRKIRWSNTALKRADGNSYAILCVGVDISDLVEAQSRLIQAERLAAIGQTTATLAHESRNALQRIRAASDVLSLEIAGNRDAEESLDMIQRASGDLQRLLEEVRSFAGPILLRRDAALLSAVWQRAWNDIAPSHEGRDAQLSATSDGGEIDIEVDVLRMEQVFRNLFENSIVAGDDPVHINLDCRCHGGFVEVRCSDNGPGLNEEQKRKIFEPFYTTKNFGTGLGMPICQRIIEAHGGTIEVEPSASGACFLIRLPHRLTTANQAAVGPNPLQRHL